MEGTGGGDRAVLPEGPSAGGLPAFGVERMASDSLPATLVHAEGEVIRAKSSQAKDWDRDSAT